MYVSAYDRQTSTLVGAKVGDPCTDSDYERIVEATGRLMMEAAAGVVACRVLIVEPGQPPPSALWRKRLAEVRGTTKAFHYVLVTSATVELGAATAIHWLQPPASGQKAVTLATFAEAVTWIEAQGGPRPVLHALHASVQKQALAASTTGSPRSEARLRAHVPVRRTPP
jgi:hypothetical protein